MRANRDEWQKRVRQWEQSGLTAAQFAAESGLNAATLENWKYKLRRLARSQPSSGGPGAPRPAQSRLPELPLVELPLLAVPADERFEVELHRGFRVRMPATFQADALRRLLQVLEGVS